MFVFFISSLSHSPNLHWEIFGFNDLRSQKNGWESKTGQSKSSCKSQFFTGLKDELKLGLFRYAPACMTNATVTRSKPKSISEVSFYELFLFGRAKRNVFWLFLNKSERFGYFLEAKIKFRTSFIKLTNIFPFRTVYIWMCLRIVDAQERIRARSLCW